jgi:hypothetical protein
MSHNRIALLIVGGLFIFSISWAQSDRINQDEMQALKSASPLNNSVRISRTGRTLKLDYELVGSDGKIYDLWDIRDNNKPTFAIYQDGVKVAGDAFSFG